jgi:hypothetical protein
MSGGQAQTILATAASYPLHLLGWKAFQDLAVSVAEECLRRPVQSFLPTNDAGRDGAFVGHWEGEGPAAGESTIQCKFTSKADENLTLSMLSEEIGKAKALAARGLARDYITLTNHPITGASELQIKSAFEGVGVGRCRTFGYDWIVRQIKTSPRLRMMVPRLYGLGDLSDVLDARAYAQAQIILSSMGDDLQRLVVTDAHRKSVRAISEHNLVLLLGAPAAGKSTIGASIAVGAADMWQSGTVRATSPGDIQRHLNPTASQFFWIDDAWGSTQYQRQTAEAWNQVFPLMQAAIKRGTRFLITSRDYIWRAAQSDLKLQAIPVLRHSQVIINVQELSTQEKAQILYNHLKMGDQPASFRTAVKPHLPEIAELDEFLPETARRLGTKFFANRIPTSREGLASFFKNPQDFLLDTISTLSDPCRAAIALVFLNGGKVRSPVSSHDMAPSCSAFGVAEASLRLELEALNGSLLLLASDESGPYWTYKHPTVSDAFACYVAGSPEKVEIYLRGARQESLLSEVVCAGVSLHGASVVVPDSLHSLLLERIVNQDRSRLRSFLSYRANREFAQILLARRPDLLDIEYFYTPIGDDADASLVGRLHSFGLLPEELRRLFAQEAADAAIGAADASVFSDSLLEAVLTEDERASILEGVRREVVHNLNEQIRRVRSEWDRDYPPEDHFSQLEESIGRFVALTIPEEEQKSCLSRFRREVSQAVQEMDQEYEPSSSSSPRAAQSRPAVTGLASLFRDVDE